MTSTKWKQRITTVTPSQITSSVTSVSTTTSTITASTTTDTSTSVVTVSNTETATAATVTSTETDTETQTTIANPTTIVSAVSSFVPIQSTLPGSQYKKRAEYEGRLHARALLQSRSKGKSICKGAVPQYAKSVDCKVYATMTMTKTVTKVGAYKHHNCHTAEYDTDYYEHPMYPADVSTTVTNTETDTTTTTLTPSATTTTTTTITVTSSNPTATTYAQCASNNFASTGPNGALSTLDDYTPETDTTTSSSYDCCVACVLDPQCQWGAWYLDGSNICGLSDKASCTSPSQYQYNIHEDSSRTTGYYEYFNGNCAQAVGYDS